MIRTSLPCSSSGRPCRWLAPPGSGALRREPPCQFRTQSCSRRTFPSLAHPARFETWHLPLFLFLDALLHFIGEWEYRHSLDLGLSVWTFGDLQVVFAPLVTLGRIVVAEMRSAAF